MVEHSVAIGRVRPPEPYAARTLDLVQRMAIDRVRILQLDLEERAHSALRRSTWLGVGILCLTAAWLGLLGAVVFALAERMPLSTSLLLVSISQLLAGAAAILLGRRTRVRT